MDRSKKNRNGGIIIALTAKYISESGFIKNIFFLCPGFSQEPQPVFVHYIFNIFF